MTEKRYYQRDFEELYYIIDSNVISEKEFDEKEMYDGYTAFEDSMTGKEIVSLLNEQHEQIERLKQNFRALDEVKCELSEENEQLKQELIELKKWEKYVGDVKRDDLDKVFKMSIYEIAEAFAYYEKRIREL